MDTSKMSEQELQFHYFKMHDADNNNKLDGCELIKSLIHWHGMFENNIYILNLLVWSCLSLHTNSFRFYFQNWLCLFCTKINVKPLFWYKVFSTASIHSEFSSFIILPYSHYFTYPYIY